MPLRAAPHVLAAMSVDYLADPRVGDVPFMKLKRFIIDAGVDKKEASNSATKFALVALAEKNDVKLDALLDQYGEAPGAATPAPEPAAPPAAAEPPPSAPEPTPAPEPEPEPAPPPAAEPAPPPAAEEPPAKAKVEKLAVPKPEAAPLAKKPPSPRGRRVSRGAASPRGSPSPRGASPRSASKSRESVHLHLRHLPIRNRRRIRRGRHLLRGSGLRSGLGRRFRRRLYGRSGRSVEHNRRGIGPHRGFPQRRLPRGDASEYRLGRFASSARRRWPTARRRRGQGRREEGEGREEGARTAPR